MPIILSVNSGSSSFKYQLIDMPSEKVLARGLMDRIGMGESCHTFQVDENEFQEDLHLENHEQAVSALLETLLNPDYGLIDSLDDIKGIGHRVVHGGEKFVSSVLVTDEVIDQLEECIDLAPLHNPANLMGIKAFRKRLPGVPAVVVFDTAFHQTMPEKTFLYSLPYEFYKKYAVRKYGAHGTSHQYVTRRAAEVLHRPIEELRLISCHLGNGASITAVQGGKSIDTSMGFTPLAGVTMGTRAGDIDAAVIPFLMEKAGKTLDEFMSILNKKSGLLGISGLSNDLRDIEEAAKRGNKQAKLAIDVFVERIRKYIGSYVMQMNGVDAIIFTAGIGENSPLIRSLVLEKLEWMGIYVDPWKNLSRGNEVELTFPYSPTKALVIPTNEEVMIARDTMKAANIREGVLS
ncbi:acetate kinase [Aneurinibacillus terranovensis]|uniref:acetate kinase n=1 Tax=Aneurinibacillus terranovensis TaxID=278991 RepID=UPI00041A03F4|nr:acetate kinase [Aneurinibacillus terranovensis]